MSNERNCYMLTRERFGWPAGTIVYDSLECDYGMASEDTSDTGIEHILVSVDANAHPETLKRGTLFEALEGPFPNFTVPLQDLMIVREGDSGQAESD